VVGSKVKDDSNFGECQLSGRFFQKERGGRTNGGFSVEEVVSDA